MGTIVRAAVAFFTTGVLTATILAEPPVGWRRDGTGRYPAAAPPVAWSSDENIIWRTKLPARSYASPIVVGDRILVLSDPAELLCVRVSDGAVLWQRSSGHAELYGAKEAQRILDKFEELHQEKRQRKREYGELRKREGTTKEELETFQQRVTEVDKRLKQAKTQYPPPSNRGGAGNTAATPVSDGKLVYAVFGTGIVSAHTVDGQRRWIKFVEAPQIGFGHGSSPVLVDGKLIVHIKDLVALDAKSGVERWRVELAAKHATPVPIRLGETDVLIVPSGALVRVRDGKILVTEKRLRVSESSPIVHNGVVFSFSGKTRAWKLPRSNKEPVELKLLWESEASSGRRTPSSVYHDGLLYAATTNGIFDVTDAQSGKRVYRKRLDIGNIYSSITVAGNLLHLGSTRGTTIVFKPGRKYEEIRRNTLESSGSCPVFAGRRMFIRGRQSLYCVAK